MATSITPNALELLSSQHDEVESLIDDIEASEDSDEKAALFRELADQIAAHTTIEEKIFYPSVMDDTTRELLLASTEEHLSVKRLVADLMELEPDNEHFEAKLTVLREQFRYHAHDEEEGKLFPLVRKLFDEEQLAGIGNEMLTMHELLLEQEPRKEVPAETAEAAPLV